MTGASPVTTIHGPAKALCRMVVRPLAGLMPLDLVCNNVNYTRFACVCCLMPWRLLYLPRQANMGVTPSHSFHTITSLRKAGCSTVMNAQEVVQQARTNSLRLVRFLYCDNGGIIRGKTTHASKLASRMREGIGQSLAMQAFTGVETLVSVDRMRSDCEIRLFPDTETIFVLPFVPPTFTILSATTPLY